MKQIELLVRDYRLTTAEILYRYPDFPSLLQTYVWQEYDQSPEFPVLKKFLDFWERSLEGRLHSVKVTNVELIKPSELVVAKGEFYLQ